MMEGLFTLIVIGLLGIAVYRFGKREGSKKGFWVGRHSRRK
jgi:hypothetical protein